jgi:hypothetical protein
MAAPRLLAANSAALANDLFVMRSTNKEPEQLHQAPRDHVQARNWLYVV